MTTRRQLKTTVELPIMDEPTTAQMLCFPKDYRDECWATECAQTRIDLPALTQEELC